MENTEQVLIDPLNQKKIEEVEMLTFSLDGKSFGVEVSKIQEIMRANYQITPMPNVDSRVIGIFMPRENIISVIDTKYSLYGSKDDGEHIKYLIVCIMDGLNVAFTCEDVKDIKRYNKDDFSDPPTTVGTDNLVTGIIKTSEDIVNIIDFEKIVAGICKTEE